MGNWWLNGRKVSELLLLFLSVFFPFLSFPLLCVLTHFFAQNLPRNV